MPKPKESTTLTTEVVRDSESLQKLQPDWLKLFQESLHTNPFADPAWTINWWNAWGENQGDLLHILANRDENGDLKSVIPLIEAHLGFSKVRPFKALKPVGRMPMGGVVMERKPLLIDPKFDVASVEALMTSIYDPENGFHWADVSGIEMDNKMPGAWWKNQDKHIHNIDNSYFLLPLPEKIETLIGSLSKNTQESLRKSFNNFKRNGRQIEFEAVTEREEVQAALTTFFQLHTARSEMQNVTPHPNYFPTETHQSFLRNVARDALLGSFQVAQLRVDGEVQASRIMLKAGQDLYLYSSGFNPDFWKDSIMRRLTTEIITHAINLPKVEDAQSIKNVNLSVGKDPNKLSWKPEEHLIGRVRFEPTQASDFRMYQFALFLGLLRGRPI